ncbi:MAG: peptide chain release factor 2 [Candidatus Saccharibacteria bacterium]|nr:peptide chain release factor 2 [Candidatus Saccharibacteria bacterium]
MQNEKRLATLKAELAEVWQKLDIDAKIAERDHLAEVVGSPDLWHNPEDARAKTERLSQLEEETSTWELLKTQTEDLDELFALEAADLEDEIATQLSAMENTLADLKKSLRFSGKYDHGNAILHITAGAGGTEAMDWAGILERMYLRFGERTTAGKSTIAPGKLHFSLVERSEGEEAGIKTAVYEVTGSDAYGLLKSEHGTHRLVRLSPFNADHLRQTSFALVEVLPILDQNSDIEIDEKDLRIDVYHSGGHGGQSVNTTNSAVRITHLPTNTVVAIQNERSQRQNKEKAMEILKGKLAQMQLESQADSINELRAGESASWGQQIRNYVMQPYQLVKDTRTKYETTDVSDVLDGNIDDFILAYLQK